MLLTIAVSVAAAGISYGQARDARADRYATEGLRREVGLVAANVTEMASIAAESAGLLGGLPEPSRKRLEVLRDELRPFLQEEKR